MSKRTLRYMLAGALVLAVGIPSVAVGFGEGRTMLLGKRNPSANSTRALNSETEIIADNGTYGTRQSNKKDGDGGGAIYGCRSDAGAEPCVRANNLKGGRAFEFETVGREAGRIEVGDTTGAPFTTNATGTAAGLNADKVDGKEAADLVAGADIKTARVNAAGALEGGRGATAAAIDPTPDTYRVTFDRDVSACTYTATPVGASSGQTLAVQGGSNPANVRVDADSPTAFHLQVIC
ncbi:MAG TPA: hypothetical protein VES79_06095 [Solirubrobacteraceae bacterium]|nr:hypothetical protein [Solirubrobacteraceae bacterium]